MVPATQDFVASAFAPALFQKALPATIFHPVNAAFFERLLPTKNTDHASQQT
jgi:hypothetical protein